MVMESRDDEYLDYLNGISLEDESISPLFGPAPGLTNGYRFRDEPLDFSFLETPKSAPNPCTSDLSPCVPSASDYPDEFGDCVIKFINQILVDEDMESKQSMFHDPLALLETERSFYEALGEQYPHPHEIPPEENFSSSSISEHSTNSSTTGSNTTDSHWSGGDSFESKSSAVQTPSLEYPLLSSFSSTTSVTNDGAFDSLTSARLVENIFSDSESMLQFNKGMEEASKFIPSIKPLVIDLDQYNLPSRLRDNTSSEVMVIKEEIVETDNSSYRGRKHYQIEDNGYEEERSSKQSAIYVKEVVSEMFDKVALCTDPGGPSMSACEEPPKSVTKKFQKGQSYGNSGGWITRSGEEVQASLWMSGLCWSTVHSRLLLMTV